MFIIHKPGRIAVTVLAMTLAIGARLGQAATLLPETTFEARYDDNVLRVRDGSDDFLGVFTPGARIIGGSEHLPWQLRATRSLVSYGRDAELRVLSDLASAKASYIGRGVDSVDVDVRYRRSTDPIDAGDDGVAFRDFVRKWDGVARLATWRGAANLRLREWTYGDAELTDGRSRNAAVRFYGFRDRTSGIFGTWTGRDLELPSQGLDLQVFTAGVERRHAEDLYSHVEIGAYGATFDDGAADDRGVAGMLEIETVRGSGGDPVTFRARIADDVTTTGHLEVEAVRSRFRLSTRYESLLDVEGGIYKSPNLTRRFRFALDGSPDGIRVVRLEGSMGKARPFHGAGPHADTNRLGLSVTFPMRLWLAGRAGYDFLRQDVPGDSERDFSRHRLMFSLTARRPQ